MKCTLKELNESFPHNSQEGSLPGTYGNLTAEQEVALKNLKDLIDENITSNTENAAEIINKERCDDLTLLRFLRARKFDVKLAYEMFFNCQKWRHENKIDTIIEDFHYEEKPIVAKYYPQYYHKNDKDGRPVYYEELGKVNLTELLNFTDEKRMLNNLIKEYEIFELYRLPACSRFENHLVETSCTILDLKGISLSAAYNVITYVKEASYIGQNYYPERMGKFYLINAPFGFSTAFKLFKPFLDPITVSKIFILSSSYKKDLLKQIDAANLPVKFGGESEVSDAEGGLLLSDVGPWRDEKYIGPEGEAPPSI
ncbi:phosphatidylinositol transfer protein Sec14p [Hanseniaspora valbyensis NRRL Y-1626]|uniref:Phosphatidylinositol transfer protein Sec14p n=1 Tax=Hanseniaspora valbyensis NRRL Y-1626 TaxID=766949 RepID=A0A1B7TJ93_9ASCO|nr:phosphatidylinositol transfer protein Sec14p [Hanseniaspora valbyensis NRRL Y-1626]